MLANKYMLKTLNVYYYIIAIMDKTLLKVAVLPRSTLSTRSIDIFIDFRE